VTCETGCPESHHQHGCGVQPPAAHEHGYYVVLAVDAMADTRPDTHRHSIDKIFPRLGETATTAEILDAVEARHRI
jgi:isochorismate hydrolase